MTYLLESISDRLSVLKKWQGRDNSRDVFKEELKVILAD